MNNSNLNDGENHPRLSSIRTWVYAGAAATAIGIGAYLFSGGSKKDTQRQSASAHQPTHAARETSRPVNHSSGSDNSASSYLPDMVARILSAAVTPNRISEVTDIPKPVITNLNSLLNDIYVRFIRLKEFSFYYEVFDTIFYDLHQKMKDVDAYYRKYSSTVQFAGSHYDNLRIKKPDEFDMDIVIDLPLNIQADRFNPEQSDINLEAKASGFVQLRTGVQFQRLPFRDRTEWLNNKAAYEWKDDCNYLLCNKFIAWFKSVVMKALNQCTVKDSNGRPLVYVAGVPYVICLSEAGPAITLLIRNDSRQFKMDVDLVPALKFPENRWPVSKAYRDIPAECKKGYWMVVPKPNKNSDIVHDQHRSWRIALHNQERELLYKTNNLRQAIRLIKKLRDARNMDKIASYYIKTLFFWEIMSVKNVKFWNNNPATLFKHMVPKLHQALVNGKIPYFWNQRNNLIGGLSKSLLTQYAAKLEPLMKILDDPTKYKFVAKYLLTDQEFEDYNAKYLHI